MCQYSCLVVGMDTDKDSKEPYRPNFMQHFDRKNEDNKRKKPMPVGPQSIYAYFPSIPDGTDFRDHVSCIAGINLCALTFGCLTCS